MRSLNETRRTKTFSPAVLLVVATLAAVLLSGCAVVGGASKAVQDSGDSRSEPSTTREDSARQNTHADTQSDAQSGARGGPQQTTRETAPRSDASSPEDEVILSLRGDSGAAFDLSCRVGDERRESSGRAPERLVFTPGENESLECVVQKKDSGGLRAAMISGDDRTIRQTNSENATITFVYRDGNISGESVSSPSSGSIQSSQSSRVTGESSGSSVRSSQSVSITD